MPYFTLHRDYILRTMKGHSIGFTKGKPAWVPPICIQDAVSIGAIPVDGEDVNVLAAEAKVAEEITPTEREKRLFKAFDQLLITSERSDFTASGLPHIKKLEEMVEFEVTSKERDTAWQAYNAAKAE